ncbi:MAG: glycosyltransferase family 2 protein [Oscillospiraceae bacterium]|nr:glycosyltransferase family 2 protein [Oscillospiraceae bacterium]
MLSIIIPALNEEENIEKIAAALTALMTAREIPCELIFVDDGSTDTTWQKISQAANAQITPAVTIKGVKFSRNFGKESAIFAGLHKAAGDAAVILDCDLQHPPALIPEMYAKWQQGFEVVEGVKRGKGHAGPLYKLFAALFYKAMKASAMDLDHASDFKLLDRKVIDALLEMPERLTFFRALSSWVGFKRAKLEFEPLPRENGKTKWSFKKLSAFALSSITSFTNFPMQMMTFSGVIFFIFACILGVNTLVQYFKGEAVEGFSTVILLILITGSFLMLGMGIIGYYLSKIYEEIKCRPRFIVAEEIGNAIDN